MRSFLIVFLCCATLATGLGIGFVRARAFHSAQADCELTTAHAAITSTLDQRSQLLVRQLDAFAGQLAQDRDFAMKLIVEQDIADPVIRDQAVRAMGTMGLSVLSLHDEQFRLLSCGHFPAAAGTVQEYPVRQLSRAPLCVTENVAGNPQMALMARVEFFVADSRYYCSGGYVIDSSFAEQLTPWTQLRILLRTQDGVIAQQPISTLSELTGGTLLINDTALRAIEIALPAPELSEGVRVIAALPAKSALGFGQFLIGASSR